MPLRHRHNIGPNPSEPRLRRCDGGLFPRLDHLAGNRELNRKNNFLNPVTKTLGQFLRQRTGISRRKRHVEGKAMFIFLGP